MAGHRLVIDHGPVLTGFAGTFGHFYLRLGRPGGRDPLAYAHIEESPHSRHARSMPHDERLAFHPVKFRAST